MPASATGRPPESANGSYDGTDIVRFWHTVELLTPPRVPPLEPRGNDRVLAIRDDQTALPWPAPSQSDPRYTTRHAVLLGVHDLGPVADELRARYNAADEIDPDPAPSSPEQRSCLASFRVDAVGVAVPGSFVLCSLPWAMGRLATGRDLRSFPAEAWTLGTRFDETVAALIDTADRPAGPILTVDDLRLLGDAVCSMIGWAPERITEIARIRQRVKVWVNEEDENDLLNSFYLDDLTRVADNMRTGPTDAALHAYLTTQEPGQRVDVRRNPRSLAPMLAPERIPRGRWPAPKPTQLVLMQQAAVNQTMERLAAGAGLFSVNGPPGTGKTTLLRDIIAAVVVERARVLAKFDDPVAAFSRGTSFPRAGLSVTSWQVDRRLHGFEIVAAASLNGAVENITRAIPGRDAIDRDHEDRLNYFADVATALTSNGAEDGEPAWGLAAAVLGNAGNRSRFAYRLWLRGDGPTLRAALTDSAVSPADWQAARRTFMNALEAEAGHRERLIAYASALRRHPECAEELTATRAQILLFDGRTAEVALQLAQTENHAASCRQALDDARHTVELLRAAKPPFLARITRGEEWRAWREQAMKAADQMVHLGTESTRAATAHIAAAAEADDVARQRALCQLRVADLTAELERIESQAQSATQAWGRHLLNDRFWESDDRERELTSPWLTPEHDRIRAEVFTAAMALHRAFILATSRQFKANLSLLMDVLLGSLRPEEAGTMLADLWATLFLVIPVVSTTFASVSRLFRGLGPSSLGWLLVDEAGQAEPQAAVGALWRARRAVVIGDPLQIEPVVTIPRRVVEAVRTDIGVAALWDPHASSVQTLADRVNPVGAQLGERWVGCPLRVHRRCLDPMFGIANRIAYDGAMVQATPEAESRIGQSLGESRWFDIVGQLTSQHWIASEGEVVADLLRRAFCAPTCDSADPDIYVISPFRSVAQHARAYLVGELSRGAAPVQMPFAALRTWLRERVGTIHTFQGKEAEAVILLLGGNTAKPGALQWAGRTPNILNVAVTRARQRLYVVGNATAWRRVEMFRLLHGAMPTEMVSVER